MNAFALGLSSWSAKNVTPNPWNRPVGTAGPEKVPLVPSIVGFEAVGFSALPSAPTSWNVIAPAGVMKPTTLLLKSVNQTFPSGPAVMPNGRMRLPAGSVNVVITPAVVMRPMRLLSPLVNHRFPSEPAVMSNGWSTASAGSVNVVTAPAVVMRPIRLLLLLVNHSAPSGPVVIPSGESTWPAGQASRELTSPPTCR